ncbi:hypothetical protein [Streptomyces griseorubiginosus]|uniref:hypothetical protein n=1 Tax=Streptomyces griseorubiginosus TaxID=67304 RepID=UPI000A670B6D|nr:hypothetical protein [Streptomyces griseorubiginosus]
MSDIREPVYGREAAELGRALRSLVASGRRPQTAPRRTVLTPFRIALLHRRPTA